MLPFQSEPLSQLRARYQAALTNIQDCRERIPEPIPSELREHVFDCEDGLRLIISRDRETKAELYLHLSASLEVGCELYKSITSGELQRWAFASLAQQRFAAISGDNEGFDLLDWSPRGIPHWRRRLEL
jgi:hypothetical protein